MKKFTIAVFSVLMLFASCGIFGETLNKKGKSDSKFFKSIKKSQNNSGSKKLSLTPKYTREDIDAEIWDLSILDTARDVDYMDEIEKDIVLEMNMARTNPKKYSELYIEPRTKKFNGKIYGGSLQTFEGVAVVNECIKFMNSQKPLQTLAPSKGLTRAAKDHAETQSLTGETGHDSTDGADPFTRMKRYGSYRTAGENISYGSKTAREIVVSLLIDDGVKSRGHRKNIMSKDFKTTGIGFAAQHKKYGCECVLDFADDFIEKE